MKSEDNTTKLEKKTNAASSKSTIFAINKKSKLICEKVIMINFLQPQLMGSL